MCDLRRALIRVRVGPRGQTQRELREPEFQPLCPQCHKEKTAAESRSLDSEILASSFDPRAWSQYVLSPRPPPLVSRVRALPESLDGFEIADVVRCRKRALELCAHELPMYCVLDQICERTECALGDLCFITARYKHFVHQLGYTGPGWVCTEAVRVGQMLYCIKQSRAVP